MAEAHHAQAPHDRPAGVHVAPQQAHDHQVQRVVADAEQRQRGKRERDEQCAPSHAYLPPEDALRAPEHHRDEEEERDHVAPFDGEEEAAHRDELREDEGGDEAAEHVAQAPQHADEEGDRAERQADRRMDVVLQHQQAAAQARQRAAERRGDGEDAVRVHAHQRHDLAVLADGADRGADVGAGQEQPGRGDAGHRDREGDDARHRERHLADYDTGGSRTPRFLNSMPKASVAAACRKNSTPPVTSSWLIGSAASTGRITKLVHQRAEQRDAGDARGHRGEQRPVVLHVQRVDRVHADHDHLGVADPHHVDDAEDQVQAERQQRQQAAQQDAVQHRFEQEYVEDFHR